MGLDSVPLLDSREPEDMKEWVGLMELWLEAKEVDDAKQVLKVQAGLREPDLVAWYCLEKPTYQAVTFANWAEELIAYVTPTNYLDDLLDDLHTRKQSSTQDVDTYICDLRSDNNHLDSANRLKDNQLCTIICSGVKEDLHACLCLDPTLCATATFKDLASGLAKLKEVLNLDNERIKAATSHHYKREQKRTQTTTTAVQTCTSHSNTCGSTPAASTIPYPSKLTELECKLADLMQTANFATAEEAKKVARKDTEWDTHGQPQPAHKSAVVKVKVEACTHSSKTKATKGISKTLEAPCHTLQQL
ncbi:hypothetical protein CALCODRAFT_482776 [Calocera cornea HHB12733]|uniref:Retrotransposon gag domain-containing protein n=1 Tax=Calocera cornea HHB12733 TaxID=1353952 RepID=A0A165GD88_9BASI|nr:hypothetical protein CALCODRAFT_482776 [Calocera cornea HHB12733]